MPERRVPQIVAESDRLDEVAVETERVTDIACDTSHELHVESAAREVVVAAEAEDLGLAVVAVVRGQVQDLLGVAHEGGAPEARGVLFARLTPKRL